ncbi:MAG: hypothetical protein HZA54_17275 [Planctomycetes bacterium]|nr:hypothetical protein [Planctomycetota bacterium]
MTKTASATAIQVEPYSIATLVNLLSEYPGAHPEVIAEKYHRTYFEEYFTGIGAQTIVVERGYVDRDYLEDYAAYYARCFERYERFCTRLHFFRIEFAADDLIALLKGQPEKLQVHQLQDKDAYAGFVVVKPLPETIVGRTCLKTYEDDHQRRHFPITRPYDVHLYGIDLRVETLAFQEQDRAAAACATSALWTVFQGTGKLFHHRIPSPVEITRIAATQSPIENRALPSEGLTVSQMAHPITAVGLEPYVVSAGKPEILRSTLYAYLRGQIPVLLAVNLMDFSDPKAPKPIDRHAVAVTGYSLGAAAPACFAGTDLRLTADRIDKFYAHDDQVGPFARMEFPPSSEAAKGAYLGTSLRGRTGQAGTVRAIPEHLVIPLYHKIRLPFEVAREAVRAFDCFFEELRAPNILEIPEPLEWDVYLTTVVDFKREVLGPRSQVAPSIRAELLARSMPRFMWRATGKAGDRFVLDLLFDATDLQQGKFFVTAVEYDPVASIVLRLASRDPQVPRQYLRTPARGVLGWFAEQPLSAPLG